MTDEKKSPGANGAFEDLSNVIELPQDRPPAKAHQAPKPCVKFIYSGNTALHTVTGQTARTLSALVKARSRGITALEVSSWAFRLSAYVYDLRKMGLHIEMLREDHPDGWHGRYILHTPVAISSAS